jgi:hypothetical protein
LRILAGLVPPWDTDEVDLFLQRTVGELGFRIPTADELARDFATEIARQIVAGAVSPEVGAGRLARLAAELGYPDWLLVWVNLEDAVYLGREGILGTVASAEAEIRVEADRLASADMHELTREELDRQRLRGSLLDGAASERRAPAAAGWFARLRSFLRRNGQ